MLGKTVSWHNGLEAKLNTLYIPGLCRWLALRGQVCSETTGPQVWEDPSGWLEGRALGCVLGLICNFGPIQFSRPQFPNLYSEGAIMDSGTLNSFPAVKARHTQESKGKHRQMRLVLSRPLSSRPLLVATSSWGLPRADMNSSTWGLLEPSRA